MMNEKIQYTDKPIGDIKIVPDFLPPPEELNSKREQHEEIFHADE